jgi:hypothetical protein
MVRLTGIKKFLRGPHAILRSLITQLGIHGGCGGFNVGYRPGRGGEMTEIDEVSQPVRVPVGARSQLGKIGTRETDAFALLM